MGRLLVAYLLFISQCPENNQLCFFDERAQAARLLELTFSPVSENIWIKLYAYRY